MVWYPHMQDKIICHASSAEDLLSLLTDSGLLLNKGKEQFIRGMLTEMYSDMLSLGMYHSVFVHHD